jgi:hypothetical protein
MLNRTAMAWGIALAAASVASATNARVESMGENADYFMDDVNIWKNPADANLYPNYLLGEMGQMTGRGDSAGLSGLARYNSDPTKPWFGAVFAKSFAPDGSNSGRYPQFIIGGALNRDDEWLAYLPGAVQIKTNDNQTPSHATYTSYNLTNFPVKFDGILGFADASGNLYGLKTYLAYSDSTSGAREVQTVLNTYTLGANLPFGTQYSLEADATLGFLSVDVKDSTSSSATGSQSRSYKSGMSPSFGADARLFVDARPLPIMVVPAVSFRSVSAPERTITNFRVGSGANVSLDRGFFWLGVDYFYSSDEVFATDPSYSIVSDSVSSTTITDNGLRVSFGIERNIWTDWFVIRVGGQKIINFRKVDGTAKIQSYSTVSTNPDINANDQDLVNFGFGLNIEDKLKIDVVVAKDILYTGGNLFGGPVDHVLSRISASYSF